jgi:hypothetical protein
MIAAFELPSILFANNGPEVDWRFANQNENSEFRREKQLTFPNEYGRK